MIKLKAFTLLELLIVIGILAILSTTMLMVINPVDLLAKARDSNRISNLSAINSAINVLMSFNSNAPVGSADTVYTSLPSNQPDCSDLGLPALPGTWVYHCATEANLRKIDANGWVPIDFTQMDTGSPISYLPVDPINTVASGLYYTYTTGGSWELNGILESEKYQQDTTVSKSNFPGVLSFGSDPSLSPIFNNSGLVGYWKLDEGTGTTTNDSSGNSNTGTLTNSPTWITGKVNNALSFDGIDDYVSAGNNASLNPSDAVTIEGWYYSDDWLQVYVPWAKYNQYRIHFYTNGTLYVDFYDGAENRLYGSFSYSSLGIVNSQWYHLTFTFDGYEIKIYINGEYKNKKTGGVGGVNSDQGGNFYMGRHWYGEYFYKGFIDEVRIYNRVLSPAEIKARYNATK